MFVKGVKPFKELTFFFLYEAITFYSPAGIKLIVTKYVKRKMFSEHTERIFNLLKHLCTSCCLPGQWAHSDGLSYKHGG